MFQTTNKIYIYIYIIQNRQDIKVYGYGESSQLDQLVSPPTHWHSQVGLEMVHLSGLPPCIVKWVVKCAVPL
jgi:hypothetical protein